MVSEVERQHFERIEVKNFRQGAVIWFQVDDKKIPVYAKTDQ